jgi:hypothetical protein
MAAGNSTPRARTGGVQAPDMTPEALAHAAVAKAVHEVGPDGRVRLEVRLSLTIEDAERLNALAIVRSRNLDGLVSDIVEQHLADADRLAAKPGRRPGKARRRPR